MLHTHILEMPIESIVTLFFFFIHSLPPSIVTCILYVYTDCVRYFKQARVVKSDTDDVKRKKKKAEGMT